MRAYRAWQHRREARMDEVDDKTDRLYRLLEDASRRVKEWPDWKRSEDSRRELVRLAEERQQTQDEGKESE